VFSSWSGWSCGPWGGFLKSLLIKTAARLSDGLTRFALLCPCLVGSLISMQAAGRWPRRLRRAAVCCAMSACPRLAARRPLRVGSIAASSSAFAGARCCSAGRGSRTSMNAHAVQPVEERLSRRPVLAIRAVHWPVVQLRPTSQRCSGVSAIWGQRRHARLPVRSPSARWPYRASPSTSLLPGRGPDRDSQRGVSVRRKPLPVSCNEPRRASLEQCSWSYSPSRRWLPAGLVGGRRAWARCSCATHGNSGAARALACVFSCSRRCAGGRPGLGDPAAHEMGPVTLVRRGATIAAVGCASGLSCRPPLRCLSHGLAVPTPRPGGARADRFRAAATRARRRARAPPAPPMRRPFHDR